MPHGGVPDAGGAAAYSVLDRSKLKHTFGIEIPHWRESMLYCLRQIGQTEPELL